MLKLGRRVLEGVDVAGVCLQLGVDGGGLGGEVGLEGDHLFFEVEGCLGEAVVFLLCFGEFSCNVLEVVVGEVVVGGEVGVHVLQLDGEFMDGYE